MQVAASLREAGFDDATVLTVVHMGTGSGDSGEDGDASTSHVTYVKRLLQ